MSVKAYLQLVRLPNVFTAAADSLAGWLLVRGTLGEPGRWVSLALASACVYAGGIALNDVFDVEVDRVERPNRPIPSGRIPSGTARFLAVGLLAAGLLLVVGSGVRNAPYVGGALVACVVLYDAGLKRSALGPETMGACRGLNLLLGLCGGEGLGGPAFWLAAVAYGLFVTGITWISRSEVDASSRANLLLGIALQNIAILTLIGVALVAGTAPIPVRLSGCLVLVLIAVIVGAKTIPAARAPEPGRIQRSIKTAILSLVWLHVGLLASVQGPTQALFVCLFWLPATYAALDFLNLKGTSRPMLLGYNTNGLAHHRLSDAIVLLAEEGYQSVALTLDAGALDPYADPRELDRQVSEAVQLLDRHGLARVVETGARFLLSPRRKHDPTLVDPDPDRRAVRVDFLVRAVELAGRLRAPVVSIWSGILPDDAPEDVAMGRIVEGLQAVLRKAEGTGVTLAFEPEPGMFIDTFARFARLDERVNHPLFQLTVDVGHVHCLETGAVGAHLREWAPRIANVHIEDMVRGVHDHLMFGKGTIDFDDVLGALAEIGYGGGLHVELSRHSHMAVDAVRDSAAFLKPRLAAARLTQV